MMKYDLEKTFKFVTNDKEWVKKLLIGGGLVLLSVILFIAPVIMLAVTKNTQTIPVIVVCWIIAAIIALGVNGFSLQTAHDYINNTETELPQWRNFKSLLFIGFKAALGTILLYLPLIFLGLMAAILFPPAKGAAADTSYAAVNIVYHLINLFYTLMVFAFGANFIQDLNVFDYTNYAKAYRLLKGNVLNYVILVAISLALYIIFYIFALLISLTIAGVLVVPFGAIYIQIVTSVLMARFVQITREPKDEQSV